MRKNKVIKPVVIKEEEKQIIAKAVECLGDICVRHEKLNGDEDGFQIRLEVKRDDIFDEESISFSKELIQWWEFGPYSDRGQGRTIDKAAGSYYARTDVDQLKESLGRHRRATAELEKKIKDLEKDD